MLTEEISDISSLLGPVLAAGTERICVQNLANPFSCFKLGKFGPCKQTVREVEYFNFLKKRGISSSFLPKYFSSHRYNGQLVMEQELIIDRPQEDLFAFRVDDFLETASLSQLADLKDFLNLLFLELRSKNIIICDLHAGNMMIYCNKEGRLKRLIVIDGFGSPEAIPLAKYISFFGRRKMDRQWEKFKRSFSKTLKRKRKDSLEFVL